MLPLQVVEYDIHRSVGLLVVASVRSLVVVGRQDLDSDLVVVLGKHNLVEAVVLMNLTILCRYLSWSCLTHEMKRILLVVVERDLVVVEMVLDVHLVFALMLRWLTCNMRRIVLQSKEFLTCVSLEL
jgi:hypothetical protein